MKQAGVNWHKSCVWLCCLMTTAASALASVHAPNAALISERVSLHANWLTDQIIKARASGNPAVERDAIRKLVSMAPHDKQLQLDLLRHLLLDSQKERKEIDTLVQSLCSGADSPACRQARLLQSIHFGTQAEALSNVRLLAMAGNYEQACQNMLTLFGGKEPPEDSLLFEYAAMLLNTKNGQRHGLELLQSLTRSQSRIITHRAREIIEEHSFETGLELALNEIYSDATRRRAAHFLQKAIVQHPDDPRIQRWRNALSEGRYWLLCDAAETAIEKRHLTDARKGYEKAVALAPSRPFAYVGLSEVAEQTGNYPLAIRRMQQAMQAADNESANYRRMLNNRIGRLKAAQQALVARKLAPAQNAAGDFLERPSNAYIDALTKQAKLSNYDAWEVYTLSRMLDAASRQQEIPDLWVKAMDAVSSAFDKLQVRYVYAQFLASYGDPREALSIIKAVVRELHPGLDEDSLETLLHRPGATHPATQWLNLTDVTEASMLEHDALSLARRLCDDIAYSEALALAQEQNYVAALERIFCLAEPTSYQFAKAADWALAVSEPRLSYWLWEQAAHDPDWYTESVFGRVRAIEIDEALAPSEKRERVGTLVAELENELLRRNDMTSSNLLRMTSSLEVVQAHDQARALLERRIKLSGKAGSEDDAMLWRRLAVYYEENSSSTAALEAYRQGLVSAGWLKADELNNDAAFTLATRTLDPPVKRLPYEEPRPLDSDGWLTSSLKARAAELYQHNQTIFRSGLHFERDGGTGGYSDLTMLTWMNEVSFPAKGGVATIRTDSVYYATGSLGGSYQNFGTREEWIGDHSFSPVNSDFGQSVAFIWESKRLSFDIGTTPMGMIYSDVSAGASWRWDWHDFGFRLEGYYRPETGSLLSIGGQRDPNTGLTWGGVRRLGAALNLSYDLGGKNGFWARASLESIKGHHVADNYGLQLMGGWYHRLVNLPNRRTLTGLSAFYWQYGRDLSDYHWGQGGYYSPEHAYSFGVMLDEARRHGNWSWQLRGQLGVSASTSSSFDRYHAKDHIRPYPLPDRDVQDSDDGSVELGVSLYGAVERRLTSRIIVGAAMSYQNSDEYAPFYAGLWLRWSLTDWLGDLSLPPTPMTPYAQR